MLSFDFFSGGPFSVASVGKPDYVVRNVFPPGIFPPGIFSQEQSLLASSLLRRPRLLPLRADCLPCRGNRCRGYLRPSGNQVKQSRSSSLLGWLQAIAPWHCVRTCLCGLDCGLPQHLRRSYQVSLLMAKSVSSTSKGVTDDCGGIGNWKL